MRLKFLADSGERIASPGLGGAWLAHVLSSTEEEPGKRKGESRDEEAK